MSVKQVTYYQAQCDCCGAVCDDYGDFSAWSDPGAAIDRKPEEWASVGDEDLCDECWSWPEDMPGYVEDEATSDDPVRKHEQHPEPGGSAS